MFVTLIDVSGSIQLLMSASELEPAATEVRDRLDLGDWLGEAGEVVTSRRGELSVDVHRPSRCCPRRCVHCLTSGTG